MGDQVQHVPEVNLIQSRQLPGDFWTSKDFEDLGNDGWREGETVVLGVLKDEPATDASRVDEDTDNDHSVEDGPRACYELSAALIDGLTRYERLA